MYTFLAFAPFLASAVLGDITVGGPRPATVRVPPTYRAEVPAPLLILLHGYGGEGTQIEGYLRFRPLTDEMGILLVEPDGTRTPSGIRFWNATDACCGVPATVDDSAYLQGLIVEVKSRLNVDPSRVYVAGWSNGGFMSYRMACDHSETIAAICSLAGATFEDPARCTAAEPVHVLQVHGTADDVIFYAGGAINGNVYPGAVESVLQWAERDGCGLTPDKQASPLDLDGGAAGFETTIARYADGCVTGGSAELWTVAGGAHGPNWLASGASTSFAQHVLEWLLLHPKVPAPIASFTASPETGPVPLEVQLDASASAPPPGTTIAKYHWDFGDGTSAESDGPAISHTYVHGGRVLARLRVVAAEGQVSPMSRKLLQAHCLPGDIAPWVADPIGEPAFPGAARFEPNESGNDLLLCAAGKAISGRSDEGLFVHQEVRGNFRLTARIADISGGNNPRVGLIFRDGIAPDARFAGVFLGLVSGGKGQIRFLSRGKDGASVGTRNGPNLLTPQGWIRVERQGDAIKGFSAADGLDWSLIREEAIAGLPEALLLGIAAVGNDTAPGSAYQPGQFRLSDIAIEQLASEPRFRRGDANTDGGIDLSDGVGILNYLFLGDVEPRCMDAADVNDSGGDTLDLSDGVAVFEFLFLGTRTTLPAPGPVDCGPDPTADPLGCLDFPPCRTEAE